MSDLVALLGPAYAKRLSDVAGGTRLYVPSQPGPHPHGGRDGFKRLSDLLGPDLAVLLIFHFSDSRLYVPKPSRSTPFSRRTIDRLTRDGLSSSDLERRLARSPQRSPRIDPRTVERLTRRGLSAPAIARQLHCSERTVRKHRALTRDGLTVRKRTPKGKGGPR